MLAEQQQQELLGAPGARIGLPEDIEFDPEHRRQRLVARYLLGIALNRLPRARPAPRLFERTQPPTRDELVAVAIREGLVEYTPWDHAPACPANDWERSMLPEGPCTCGAEFHKIRLTDR